MEKHGKNIPAMRTIFKPPEGIFFFSCLQIHLEVRAKKT